MEQEFSYIPLESVEDIINEVSGGEVGLTAAAYANGTDITIENDTPETYPDLMFHYVVDSAVVNGVPVEPILIGGAHPTPPARPK